MTVFDIIYKEQSSYAAFADNFLWEFLFYSSVNNLPTLNSTS